MKGIEMSKYLGEKVVDISKTPYQNFTKQDWVMYYLERYGQIDGDRHKSWVLDQIAKILKGTKVIVTLASWDNGETELRINLDEPSQEYNDWVHDMVYGGEDEEQYFYDEGIAP